MIKPSGKIVAAYMILSLLIFTVMYIFFVRYFPLSYGIYYIGFGIVFFTAFAPFFKFYLIYLYNSLEITGDGITLNSGIFSKITKTLPFNKIDEIEIRTTILKRYLSIGDIAFFPVGENKIIFPYIDNPEDIRNIIIKKMKEK